MKIIPNYHILATAEVAAVLASVHGVPVSTYPRLYSPVHGILVGVARTRLIAERQRTVIVAIYAAKTGKQEAASHAVVRQNSTRKRISLSALSAEMLNANNHK